MVAMGDLRKSILGSERSTLIGTTNRNQSCYLTCKECLQRLRIIDGFTFLRSFSKMKGGSHAKCWRGQKERLERIIGGGVGMSVDTLCTHQYLHP